MDLESKVSSLKSYVKLSTQDEATRKNEDTSNSNAEANAWWGSISNKAQEPDPWLPGLNLVKLLKTASWCTFTLTPDNFNVKRNVWAQSKTQRIVGFFMCLLLGVFCFGMAAMLIPFIILKSRKFVALYTMGSIFTLGSFSLLWGPYHHLKHLLSVERLPFTLAYFGSMSATLYVAIFMKSTFLTLFCAVIQVVTLLWYMVSYIPGGTTGMKMMSRFFSSAAMKTVSKTLPV